MSKRIQLAAIVTACAGSFCLAPAYADTTGSPLSNGVDDGAYGVVSIFTGTFGESGMVTNFAFFNDDYRTGWVTPLIFDKNGDTYTLTGVGTPVWDTGDGIQNYPFTLLAGSASVTSGVHTFGQFCGQLVSDGAGGINKGSQQGGIIDFNGGGTWVFTGGAEAGTFEFEVGSVFEVGAGTGGDGSAATPYGLSLELNRSYSMQATSSVVDADGDGLSDDDEIARGTDPQDADTDNDGLEDGTEVDMQSLSGIPNCPDPLNSDSDGDLLSDGTEVANGTDPCSEDSDGDGLLDAFDVDPVVPGTTVSAIEQSTRVLADIVEIVDLNMFSGSNDNASAGRRNSMVSKVRKAANFIASGKTNAAISLLSTVQEKVDGQGDDWMLPSSEAGTLFNGTSALMLILGS